MASLERLELFKTYKNDQRPKSWTFLVTDGTAEQRVKASSKNINREPR